MLNEYLTKETVNEQLESIMMEIKFAELLKSYPRFKHKFPEIFGDMTPQQIVSHHQSLLPVLHELLLKATAESIWGTYIRVDVKFIKYIEQRIEWSVNREHPDGSELPSPPPYNHEDDIPPAPKMPPYNPEALPSFHEADIPSATIMPSYNPDVLPELQLDADALPEERHRGPLYLRRSAPIEYQGGEHYNARNRIYARPRFFIEPQVEISHNNVHENEEGIPDYQMAQNSTFGRMSQRRNM